MRALAGVMKYVGIVLISGVLILAFCVGLMFFMPKMRLFGYYFRQVDARSQLMGEPIDLSSSFSGDKIKLTIEAHDYDIIIQPIEVKDKCAFYIYQETDYIGFLKGVKENEGTPLEKTVAKLYPERREASINKSDPSAGVYHWIFDEPQGILSMNAENKIVINVPYSKGGKPLFYDLDITTHNGDIHLTNSVDEKDKYLNTLNISGLSLKTNKGNAYFKGIGSNVDEGTEGEGENTQKTAPKVLRLNNLDITTNGGTFDFRKFEKVTVLDKVELTSKKAKYLFNTVATHDGNSEGNLPNGIVVNGDNVEFRADSVYCGEDGFTFKSTTGVLDVKKLISGKITDLGGSSKWGYVDKYIYSGDGYKKDDGKTEFYIQGAVPYENTIFTDTAAVKLGTIVGKLGMYNELGDVVIDTLCHQASIRTENGDIVIEKSGVFPDERSKSTKEQMGSSEVRYAETSSLILYSTYGNIEVKKYYQDAVVHSKKGKIRLTSMSDDGAATTKGSVSFSTESVTDATDKITVSGYKRYFYTDVTTKDGQVWVTSDKNPVRVNASDNATINVVVKDVLPEKIELGQYYKYNAETKQKEITVFQYSLNPFNDYMYEFKTENGTVDATLPLKSYTLRIDCKKIEGNVGATEADDFKVKDSDGKLKPVDVQISSKNDKQCAILIDGKKAVVRSDI